MRVGESNKLSSMSLTFSGSIIGISYGEMNSVKSNLRRANDMLQQSQSKISSAKTKVQVDRSSSRLRLSEEQISTIYTNAAKQKTKIDKLCNNIDITIRKFKEVDARCAARIRSISKSYDKSKSLWDRIKSAVSSFSSFAMNGFKSLIDMGNEAISALGQKASEGFNAVSEWMDKHPVVVNIVTGTLDVLAISTTAVAIVAGTVTGVGLVFAAVGAVYSASTLIDSGVKIYNNIKNGTNSGFNFIEEGFKKVMGDKAGEVAFGVTNLIALAVNLPSMAKGALKLGTGAINFFKEGEGIAKIGASISGIGKNISSFLDEGKAVFKALGQVGKSKLDNFLESIKDVKNNIGKTLEEIKIKIQSIGDVTKGGKNPKLIFNNVNEYYVHISDIGKRTDITNDEKLRLIQEAYEALGGKKGDVTCISDIKYITGFDLKTGRPIVDWPVKMGFAEDGIKGVTRDNPLPNQWDRIGAIGGENFTTLPDNGKPFSYDERAIPYIESTQARHVGEFNNENYFDIIDAIADNDINKLNDIMANTGMDKISNIEFKAITKDYNYFIGRVRDEVGNIDGKYGLKGNVAPWKINDAIHMQGGAEQIVTPVKGNILERLGVLKVEF